jgi:hypothetical protein
MNTLNQRVVTAGVLAMTCLLPMTVRANHNETEIAASLEELAGVWMAEGYGQILNINAGMPMAFERFEISDASCLLRDSAELHHLQGAVGRVLRNPDSSRFTHIIPGNLTTFAYHRLEELPAQCRNGGTGNNTDPLFNFDVFWATFDEMYAFFERRGVNWQALRDQHRPRLVAENTEEMLFQVLVDMVTPLCDGHVEFGNDTEAYNSGVNPVCLAGNTLFLEVLAEFGNQQGFGDPFEYFRQVIRPGVVQNIQQTYAQGPLAAGGQGLLHWGDLGGGVGYLGVLQMTDYAGAGATAQQDLEVLEPLLDEIMGSFTGMAALVVDIRLNTGGYDHVALEIASRLADRPRVAFTKHAHQEGSRPSPQVNLLDPPPNASRPPRIVILTSSLTASAAENFLLAMRTLPYVTVVGESTVGVHSDVLERHMPNGWTFSLSNEIYTAPDGTVFEGLGMPPDIEIPVLRAADRSTGRDTGIETALALLATPPVEPGLAGTWWNADRGGEGYTFDFFSLGQERFLFVTFYTYDADGNQAYLVGVTREFTNPVVFNLGITRGGVFGPAYDPANQQEEPWGTLTVNYRECMESTVTLAPSMPGYEGYTTTLERLGRYPHSDIHCS